jgi:hypothetical protein
VDLLQVNLTFSSCLENKSPFQMNNMMLCVTYTSCVIGIVKGFGLLSTVFSGWHVLRNLRKVVLKKLLLVFVTKAETYKYKKRIA